MAESNCGELMLERNGGEQMWISRSDDAGITVTFTQKLPGPELTVEQTAYLGHDDGTTCPGLDEIDGAQVRYPRKIEFNRRCTNGRDFLEGRIPSHFVIPDQGAVAPEHDEDILALVKDTLSKRWICFLFVLKQI